MDPIEVVAAVIVFENNILCVQRGESKFSYISYKYEFPGGKIEKNETREAALIREIKEELDMEISVDRFFITNEYSYPDKKLILHSFICTCANSRLILREHLAFNWLPIEKLKNLDWAEADKAILDKLVKNGISKQID